MKKLLIISLALSAVAAIAWWLWFQSSSRSTPPDTIQDVLRLPGGQETMEAGECLVTLLNEGKLPGVSLEEHGDLVTDEVVQKPETDRVYPATRGFHFESRATGLIHHYTVVLPKQGDTWRLERAWDTDRAGQVVREYNLKTEAKP